MLQELINKKQYLQKHYRCSWIKRNKELKPYKNKYNKKFFLNLFKEISKSNQINETSKENAIRFIKWIIHYRCLIITGKTPCQICFKVVKKDFSLFAQIAFSLNAIRGIPYFDFVLEIHYLVAVKEGFGVGAKFIKDFIAFSDSVKLPIVLYCEPSLVSYYNKFGFVAKSINYQGYYLMVYGSRE